MVSVTEAEIIEDQINAPLLWNVVHDLTNKTPFTKCIVIRVLFHTNSLIHTNSIANTVILCSRINKRRDCNLVAVWEQCIKQIDNGMTIMENAA